MQCLLTVTWRRARVSTLGIAVIASVAACELPPLDPQPTGQLTWSPTEADGIAGEGSATTSDYTGPKAPPGMHGYFSYEMSPDLSREAFLNWRRHHVHSCGGDSVRVVRDTWDGSDTVSEGIGYGMLLAVAHNDQELLDGLWRFYKQHSTHGLMAWRVAGCHGVDDPNTASDAELDVAMALIQAECRWGGYADDARRLLGLILAQETIEVDGLRVLRPGREWWPRECVNPSYFAPGYYRAFARFDATHAHEWLQLADDSYILLERIAHPETGLVPDWADVDGTPIGSCGQMSGANYSWDAMRTPWRIATDYVWHGHPSAKAFLDRVTHWASSRDLMWIGGGYSLDGHQLAGVTSSAYIGSFSLAAMSHSQRRADIFAKVFGAQDIDDAYYERSLRAVYLLLATGSFSEGCEGPALPVEPDDTPPEEEAAP